MKQSKYNVQTAKLFNISYPETGGKPLLQE